MEHAEQSTELCKIIGLVWNATFCYAVHVIMLLQCCFIALPVHNLLIICYGLMSVSLLLHCLCYHIIVMLQQHRIQQHISVFHTALFCPFDWLI